MKFKKWSVSLVFVVSSCMTLAQGIPTFDESNLAQALLMVDHMKSQINNQLDQLERLESQERALSGSRGMGDLFNDPALRNYLPENWKGVYDQVKSGRYGGAEFEQIYSEYGITTDNEHAIAIYETDAANTAILRNSYQNTLARLNNIEGLLRNVDTTVDIKAAADLQNRIAVEQAIIQNEQNRLNLMMRLAEAERTAQQEKARRYMADTYIK